MDSGYITLVSWRKKNSAFFTLLWTALLTLAVGASAWAQVSASIAGRIEDPSGAAIPEAMVTVTSLETGAVHAVSSDNEGSYRVLQLPPGRYEVKAEKPGFKASIQTGVDLAVAQQGVVNLKLEVGTVTEQVTVTAEAPVVNTTTSSVTGLVNEKEVKDLPLNGRSFDQLILLNAGTVSYTALSPGGAGTPGGNRFSVAGRRDSENYFLFNGVELAAPNLDTSMPFGVSGQLLGIDSVREFNVQTDAYGAEYGKRPGGQVSVVTSSGTNQLHGSIFEFLRNSDLDTRNFFDQASVPPFKRNQFGGSAGAPIKKDKTFIFANYEGLRLRLGESVATPVPDANARLGLLPNAQGVPTSVAGLQPGMLPYLAYWPVPNGQELGGGVALFFGNPSQQIREDYGTERLDQRFSDKDSVSEIFQIDDGFNYQPLVADPVFANNVTLRSQTLSIPETHIFSPNVINVFTAGLAHSGYHYATPAAGSFPASLSLVAGGNPGLFQIGGGTSGGGAAGSVAPGGPSSPAIQFDSKLLMSGQDQVSLVKGKHTFTIGGLMQHMANNSAGVSKMLGQASFANLTSLLQGQVLAFQVIPNTTARTWRQWNGAWYVQDSIQLRPNLTLRVGLRHEFNNGWNDPTGRAANFIFQNGVIQTNPIIGDTPLTQNNMRWLFGPRIGLAWDPTGSGKTSIRAGFGTYYWVLDDLGSNTKQVPPFNGAVTFSNQAFLPLVPVQPSVPVPPTCQNGPVSTPGVCTIFADNGIQPNLKTPTVEEWNFSIERQVTNNSSVRASYVGSEAYHELVAVEVDSIPPQVCNSATGCVSGGLNAVHGLVPQGTLYIPVQQFRPNPNFAAGYNISSRANAGYNALQLEFKQRFTRGFELKANYTWSKSLDTGSGSGLGSGGFNEVQNVIDPYNMALNKGLDGHNQTHQLSMSGAYELPFGQGKPFLSGVTGIADKVASGWQLNFIASVLSGFPITPVVSSNVSGNGDTSNPDRASWNPAFTGPVVTGNPHQWFNPNAFIVPVSGTWGNVPRGALLGPGLANFDFSIFKTMTVTERMKLQFRAEVFNLFNHPNFTSPNNSVFSGGQLTSSPTINPSAGVISGPTATTSRQIQFGLKLSF